MQARPCPTFGRPVHRRGSPHRLRPGTSPHALRIPPRDGHPALRSSNFGLRPASRYSRFWIWRPSSEHQRDFNPPEQCAAQRTLRAPPPSTSADAGPRGFIVESDSRSQTSLVAHSPYPTRAAVTTPVESPAAVLARFAGDIGLPQSYGGSTSTLAISRPARRSLALQPAWTTNPLKGTFSRSASGHSSPLDPPRVFPAGARVCRPGFPPGRKMHLVKAHIT